MAVRVEPLLVRCERRCPACPPDLSRVTCSCCTRAGVAQPSSTNSARTEASGVQWSATPRRHKEQSEGLPRLQSCARSAAWAHGPWVLLMLGGDTGDPLILQMKEVQPSVLEAFAGRSNYANAGQRVVVGQRCDAGQRGHIAGLAAIRRFRRQASRLLRAANFATGRAHSRSSS